MTAPRPKIQRWEMKSVKVGSDPFDWETSMVTSSAGFYVEYPAHLRAVTLAKIEVLHEVVNDCVEINDAGQEVMYKFIRLKIAALRKELEG